MNKPIEKIQPGDQVVSADSETGKQSAQKVVRVFVRTSDELFTIVTEDGGSIEATGEHPFWVEGKGFVAAKRLARSDLLRTASGQSVAVRKVSSRQGEFTVYNFEVENTHTYYAGDWWVHNTCPRTFTSPDPDVADLANAIEARYPGLVEGVNVEIEGMEVDIALRNAIIEVKGGRGTGLGRQVSARQSLGRPVVGYAKRLGPHAAREINSRGGIAAGGTASDIETLLQVLKP